HRQQPLEGRYRAPGPRGHHAQCGPGHRLEREDTALMAHRFVSLAPAIAAGILVVQALVPSAAARAQGWKPERNVEVVVGLTAGSSQDRTGRALQKIWQDTGALGVTSSVANRVGGGGQIAWNHLAQHAGDGHYVLVVSPSIVTSQITGASRLAFGDF